jgi:hypothetical protein
MSERYDPEAILADPEAHPVHKMYAEINIGIRDRGERWSKCMNCGTPYRFTSIWDNPVACSQTCLTEYVAYVSDSGAF